MSQPIKLPREACSRSNGWAYTYGSINYHARTLAVIRRTTNPKRNLQHALPSSPPIGQPHARQLSYLPQQQKPPPPPSSPLNRTLPPHLPSLLTYPPLLFLLLSHPPPSPSTTQNGHLPLPHPPPHPRPRPHRTPLPLQLHPRLPPRRHGLGPDHAVHPARGRKLPPPAAARGRRAEELDQAEGAAGGVHGAGSAAAAGVCGAVAGECDGECVVLPADWEGG